MSIGDSGSKLEDVITDRPLSVSLDRRSHVSAGVDVYRSRWKGLVLAVAGATVGVATAFATNIATGSESAFGGSVAVFAIIAGAVSLLGAAASYYVASRYARQLDRSDENDSLSPTIDQASYERHFAELIGRLGDERAIIRLGAIYSLERLANLRTDFTDSVTSVLAAYLRVVPPDEDSPDASASRQVQQAAINVLGRTRRPDERIDLSGVVLSGMALERIDLSFVDLSGADLSGAGLTGISFRGAKLANANLRGASLAECVFEDAVLSYADFSGAALTGCTFRQALITGVSFRGASIASVDFTGAFVAEVDLAGASIEDSALSVASVIVRPASATARVHVGDATASTNSPSERSQSEKADSNE